MVGGGDKNHHPGNIVGVGKRHFVVRYRMDTRGYYLKDTGEGSGTFVRVDRPLVNTHRFLITPLDLK